METEIIKISPCDIEGSAELLQNAAEVIRHGGLVVFPTETVYGLGGDGTNPRAAEKIFAAKGRPSDNPLIIHVASPEDAEKYACTTPMYYKLAQLYMPGPITVIMEAKDTVPLATRGGLSTVAVRCPSNPIANALIKYAKCPIAAPSANLSGSPSPTTARHAIDDMLGRVDVIIDGGDCDFGLESTIVKINSDDSITLLRPGKITAEELSLVAKLDVADAVVDKLRDGEVALSPGMKYRHYAPKSPVILLDGDVGDAIRYITENGTERIAVISYSEDVETIKSAIPSADVYEFGVRTDESTQAHQLFAILRDADKKNYDKIYAPLPSKFGIGLALYNRMIRAAAHTIINLRQHSED